MQIEPMAFFAVPHVGLVVPSLEAAMDGYIANFGMTFYTFDIDETLAQFGSSSQFNLRFGLGLLGGVTIELIAPVAGETVYSAYLRCQGPGVHHLGVCVADLNAAREQLERRNYQLLMAGKIEGLAGFAYYQATDMHCIIEPLELSGSLPLFFAKHARKYSGR